MKNKKATRDNTASTRNKIRLALFLDPDTINDPIFSNNSPTPTFVFCIRETKRVRLFAPICSQKTSSSLPIRKVSSGAVVP